MNLNRNNKPLDDMRINIGNGEAHVRSRTDEHIARLDIRIVRKHDSAVFAIAPTNDWRGYTVALAVQWLTKLFHQFALGLLKLLSSTHFVFQCRDRKPHDPRDRAAGR